MRLKFTYSLIDLDWTLQYVACPSNAAQDLTLESVSVGPVHVGVNKFILQVIINFSLELSLPNGHLFAGGTFGSVWSTSRSVGVFILACYVFLSLTQ